MRAVVQRVARAWVEVEGETVGRIGQGLLVYLGAGRGDADADAGWMAQKLDTLRVFQDDAGKMSLSVRDVAEGASLSWDDVDYDAEDEAVKLRREMEAAFGRQNKDAAD